MTETNEKTRAQKLMSKITDKPIVAYVLVAAAILGAIANFTGTVEKVFDASIKLLPHLSKVDPNRPPSVWIRIDSYDVKDEAGIKVNETPKEGRFVQVAFPPVTSAIADLLPLKIPSKDGMPPKPRRVPLLKLHEKYYNTFIPQDVYELLDVDVVEIPTGRAIKKRKGELDRIVYLDSENKEIQGAITQTHIEVWGRIENLKSFGNQ